MKHSFFFPVLAGKQLPVLANNIGHLAEFGEYTIDLMSEEPLEGFIIRTISVFHNKAGWSLCTGIYLSPIKSASVSEGTPSDSVPHHLLGTRWSVFQPEGCGGCDRRSGQGPEENWKQTHICPLQVMNYHV